MEEKGKRLRDLASEPKPEFAYSKGDLVKYNGQSYVVYSQFRKVRVGLGNWECEYQLCQLNKEGKPDRRIWGAGWSRKRIRVVESQLELIKEKYYLEENLGYPSDDLQKFLPREKFL